jgi:hypothetical protein
MENLPFQPYSFKKKKKNTALSPFYKPAAEVTFKSCLLFKLVKTTDTSQQRPIPSTLT